MKKYILVLFSVAIIIPSIAFASWWNPFTWFNKKNTETPQIQQVTTTIQTPNIIPTTVLNDNSKSEIEQLQKQINDLKNQQLNSNTIKTTPIKKTNTVKVSAPVITQEKIVTIPVSTPIIEPTSTVDCKDINDEETLLVKNSVDSYVYISKDLLNIINDKQQGTFSTQYNNYVYVHNSFFSSMENFKKINILKIESKYLDNNYIQSIKDGFLTVANGYEDFWNTWQSDLIILKSENPNDSYDKYKALDLINKDFAIMKTNASELEKTRVLLTSMKDKYQEIKTKNNCTSSNN